MQINLRPVTTEDVDFMISLVSDSETTRFLPGMITDREIMIEWICSLGKSDNEFTISCDGVAAGECSLTVSGSSAEIGLMLLPKYWRLGIGTYVVFQLLQLADSKEIKEVTAVTDSGNEAAIALLEKTGFRRRKTGWMFRIIEDDDSLGQEILEFVRRRGEDNV